MKAKFRIDQLRHGGAFVVSDEVAKHLQDLDVKRRDIHERIPAVGPDVVKKYFDADNAVVAKAIEAITESVTRELRPRWWQVLSR